MKRLLLCGAGLMFFVLTISGTGSAVESVQSGPHMPTGCLLAYLDPGTGSFVIQSMLAIVLTGGAMLATFWKKIVSFFCRRENDTPENRAEKDVA